MAKRELSKKKYQVVFNAKYRGNVSGEIYTDIVEIEKLTEDTLRELRHNKIDELNKKHFYIYEYADIQIVNMILLEE